MMCIYFLTKAIIHMDNGSLFHQCHGNVYSNGGSSLAHSSLNKMHDVLQTNILKGIIGTEKSVIFFNISL